MPINQTVSNPTTHRMTRDETIERAKAIASVIPNATVRRNAWNITVVSTSGKHLVSYLGNKDGFIKA